MADNRKGTYAFQATDATRESILLRAAFAGTSGSGKTKTALILGTRMVERLKTGPLYVIDSESKSALRYAYSPRSGQGFKFKHVAMPEDDQSLAAYTAALDYCEAQGAGVILIDSASHAWAGIGGVLEQVDEITSKSRSKNTFGEGWRAMSPAQTRFMQRMISTSCHLLVTYRAKSDYVIQENERGKREPVKVGMAPIAKEGSDYEFDVWFDMVAPSNTATVGKTRVEPFGIGESFVRPGVDFADTLIDWIRDAEPAAGARTLGEAITVAVADGITAAECRSPDAYKAAKEKLTDWCRSNGIAEDRYKVALAQFKERIAAATGPKMPAHVDAAPPSGRPAVNPPTPAPAEPVAVAPIDEAAVEKALRVAVAAGIEATEVRSPDRYKGATQTLVMWCDDNGLSPVRREMVLAQFKARVSDATDPRRPVAAPPRPVSDEDRARAIDEGREPATAPVRERTPLDDALDGLRVATCEADVRVYMSRELWAKYPSTTDEGVALRSAVEAAMQRFVAGWTIEGARAAAKAAEDAKKAAAGGGAPDAAKAPAGTTKATRVRG